MTGEITLRGQVLPVGGIKEKVLAAHRNGLKIVVLPKRNEFDLDDVPEEIKNKIQFIFVETVDECVGCCARKETDKSKTYSHGHNPNPGRLKKKMPRIMLAEDDHTMVTLLKTLLGMEGYQVVALSVEDVDVFEAVRNDRPDILLLDVHLPHVNGLDVLDQGARVMMKPRI